MTKDNTEDEESKRKLQDRVLTPGRIARDRERAERTRQTAENTSQSPTASEKLKKGLVIMDSKSSE